MERDPKIYYKHKIKWSSYKMHFHIAPTETTTNKGTCSSNYKIEKMTSVDWNDFTLCLPAIKLHTSRTQSMEYRPSYLPPPTITFQC